jgi:hypothetical protein
VSIVSEAAKEENANFHTIFTDACDKCKSLNLLYMNLIAN